MGSQRLAAIIIKCYQGQRSEKNDQTKAHFKQTQGAVQTVKYLRTKKQNKKKQNNLKTKKTNQNHHEKRKQKTKNKPK